MTDRPFLEHPTGAFATAVDAMTDAINRLMSGDQCDRWFTFSAQGQGSQPDSYHIVDLPVKRRSVDVGGRDVDLYSMLSRAGLDGSDLGASRTNTVIELPRATAVQFARFLDCLFRHLGIHPFDGEDDYAVGAEQ